MKNILIAAFVAFFAVTAHAETPHNIFLSGKVFKGEEVVETFAAPTILGAALPVKNQVLHSYIEKAVTDGKRTDLVPGKLATGLSLTITPTAVSEDNVLVAVSGELTSLHGFDKAPVAGTDLAIELPKLTSHVFSNSFAVNKHEPLEFGFGNCTLVEGNPTDCTHKLVLSAAVSN